MEEHVNPRVVLSTSLGDITVELDTAKAPVTSENFLAYVASGILRRHDLPPRHPRLHDPGRAASRPNMQQKPTSAAIANEAANGLKNSRGTLAMARTSDPHSATGQFFINLKNNSFPRPHGQDQLRLGICGVRQGRGRHGRGGRDRPGAHRHVRPAQRRAHRARGHHQGRAWSSESRRLMPDKTAAEKMRLNRRGARLAAA